MLAYPKKSDSLGGILTSNQTQKTVPGLAIIYFLGFKCCMQNEEKMQRLTLTC